VSSIAAGIVMTAISGVLNYSKYGEHYRDDGMGYLVAGLTVTFISATVLAFVVLPCINYLNKKKQAQIQRRLDKDEQDE
jgi:ABC-type thiamin/hydroxymethylpyrimidine transport system permease subunit